MKAFFIGVSIVAVAFFISVFSSDLTLLYKITGGVTIALLVMCASTLGAFPDVDGFRGTVLPETKEDRESKFFITNRLLLIGLPNALTAILVYYLI
ncbi:DUF5316 domain-containing protein [Domibacillus tundrae]|uniref:DUF5316 domain-containing protein n=1 Tax=Domibacillus tundrae TaxID=1587527 RepID=UPI000617C627|nr:DUF5316 family protein [Domibacillus tundrae]